MKYIKIRKIQISGLPPQRRTTRKLNECSFGPCSRFWHPNLSSVHQDAKIADMHRRSRNRAVSRMIISQVLICINFHTAMHSDRFLAAEIEIAKSARCQTTRARTSCSRYRRKLYHIHIYIPESVRHSQPFSGWNLKLTLFGNQTAFGLWNLERQTETASERLNPKRSFSQNSYSNRTYCMCTRNVDRYFDDDHQCITSRKCSHLSSGSEFGSTSFLIFTSLRALLLFWKWALLDKGAAVML